MSTQAPEQDEQQDAYLDVSQLSWLEAVGMVSGALLFVSLFLPWFSTGSNPDSDIATAHIGPNASATAFQTFRIADWLFVLLSTAPFVLAWIIARRHTLDWPTGEVTMVAGLIGIFLVICNGLILGKPEARDRGVPRHRLVPRPDRLLRDLLRRPHAPAAEDEPAGPQAPRHRLTPLTRARARSP